MKENLLIKERQYKFENFSDWRDTFFWDTNGKKTFGK